ncbi:MAG: hypothetical protein ACKPA7_05670 [Sphaerospermopsis kisseleviana]
MSTSHDIFHPIGLAITQTIGCTTFNSYHQKNQVNAQTPTKPAPQEIVQVGEIRPLPGSLDVELLSNRNVECRYKSLHIQL